MENNLTFLRDHPEAREFLTQKSKEIPGLILLLHASTLGLGDRNTSKQYVLPLAKMRAICVEDILVDENYASIACNKFLNERCTEIPPR